MATTYEDLINRMERIDNEIRKLGEEADNAYQMYQNTNDASYCRRYNDLKAQINQYVDAKSRLAKELERLV